MKTERRRLNLGDASAVVTVTAKPKRPKRKVKLSPYHLTHGAKVPSSLKKDVENYLRIADGLGVPREKINREIAEYLVKGYHAMAQRRAA
jgi:hypothetical protein